MSVIVTCKRCKKKMKAPDSLAGKRVRCKCGKPVNVPAASEPILAPLADDLSVDSYTDPKPQPIDIGEIAALAEGEQLVRGQSCPECFADIPEDGVICTACGYDLRIGRRLGTEVQTDRKPEAQAAAAVAKPKKEKKVKKNDPDAPDRSAMVGRLLKIGAVAACIAGLLFGTLCLKNALFFNPQQQMEDAHAKIFNGMTAKQVVDELGRPPTEVLVAQPKKKRKSQDPVAALLPASVKWEAGFIKKYSDQTKFGFEFVYKYSERAELRIQFNGRGRVLSAIKHDPLERLFGK